MKKSLREFNTQFPDFWGVICIMKLAQVYNSGVPCADQNYSYNVLYNLFTNEFYTLLYSKEFFGLQINNNLGFLAKKLSEFIISS